MSVLGPLVAQWLRHMLPMQGAWVGPGQGAHDPHASNTASLKINEKEKRFKINLPYSTGSSARLLCSDLDGWDWRGG